MFKREPMRVYWIKKALMPLILLQSLMGQSLMEKGGSLWEMALEGLFCP